MDVEHGQVAIYDAVNPTAAGRRQLAKEFARKNIQTIFIESACYDQRIIEENVRNVKISSPDVSLRPYFFTHLVLTTIVLWLG